MGRPTSSEAFSRLVHAARASIPDLAVTTDVLVGFPGENEDAFHESYEFVKQMTFAKLHVFPYSRRPGTPAARLPDQVPRTVRDRRARRMRSLGAEQRRRFQRQFIGREMKVLWEQRQRDSRWVGWTDNYIRVAARAEANLRNQITGARLLALENGHLEGAVVP
jgi:threonylcarbamoyladenosine tRNA methylthiotransferase MtaB